MLELKALTDVSIIEITLGLVFTLISIAITFYLYKMKKTGYFVNGFVLLTLWNALETIDELFIKNATRELIFNLGGRIILIIALIVLILGFKQFLGFETKAKK